MALGAGKLVLAIQVELVSIFSFYVLTTALTKFISGSKRVSDLPNGNVMKIKIIGILRTQGGNFMKMISCDLF